MAGDEEDGGGISREWWWFEAPLDWDEWCGGRWAGGGGSGHVPKTTMKYIASGTNAQRFFHHW